MEETTKTRTRRTKAEMEAAREVVASTHTPETDSFEDVRFGSIAEFVSHAFKLTVSSFKKHFLPDNIRPTQADWHNIEHVHIFHSQNSDGKEQIHSAPVGGHFHIVTLEKAPKGKVPRILTISGPKKFVMQKDSYGIKSKTIADFNPGVDNHTHEIEYIGSSKVKPRTINPEATKVVSYEANKTAPIPDVIA